MVKVGKDSILHIKPYVTGKSTVSNIGNNKICKLSSNENPFGCSPNIIKNSHKLMSNLNRYPDGSNIALIEKIAELNDINKENIICGAGSDELIAMIINAFSKAGDEIVFSEHSFLMYKIYSLSFGCVPVVAKEVNLQVNMDNIIRCLSTKSKVIFIATPNNPTGSIVPYHDIKRLLDNINSDVLVVIDCAYFEYVDEVSYASMIELVAEYNNLIMLRTFSKIYGLAALRIGWACADSDIIQILNRVRGPFNVNKIAQETGIIALSDQNFILQSREHNQKWYKILFQEINQIGLIAHKSYANFILIEFGNGEKNAHNCYRFLLNKGIIVRNVEEYGLGNHLRCTIGLEQENQMLIDSLQEFVSM